MTKEEWMSREVEVYESALKAIQFTRGQLNDVQLYTLEKLADSCARPMSDFGWKGGKNEFIGNLCPNWSVGEYDHSCAMIIIETPTGVCEDYMNLLVSEVFAWRPVQETIFHIQRGTL